MANPIATTYPDTPERDIEQAARLLARAFARIAPYEHKLVVIVPTEAWPHFEFRVRSAAELLRKHVEIAPVAFSTADMIVMGGVEFRRGGA